MNENNTQAPPQTPAPETAKPRRSRWLRLVLVLSLAANLAVVGVIVGAVVKQPGRGESRHKGPARELGLGLYGRAMDRSDREGLRESLKLHMDKMSVNRQALRSALENTLTLLRATPFDREAMQAEMEAQRAAIEANQALGNALLLDHLSKMSPEARAAFADRLERRLGREPGRDKDKKH